MNSITEVSCMGRACGKCVVLNGTHFSPSTPESCIRTLEALRQRPRPRVRIHYGDPETGQIWDDPPEIGLVGRSTGGCKIPVICHNRRSIGGGAILDDCILKIEYSNKKLGGVVYEVSQGGK